MRGLLTLVFVVLFAACPLPVGPECQRFLVDVNGNQAGNFGGAGGSSGGGNGFSMPVAYVGVPVKLKVFAPLTSCPEDTLRADLELTEPDNQTGVAMLDGTLQTVSNGAALGTVGFTPTKPGMHTVKVAFEPSLGVRSVLVDVAFDGLRGATTRVPIPSGGNCVSTAVWPLTDDSVACEERSTGFISVTSSDGGVSRFRGTQLVVADTVLWSINDTTTSLERRVFEDGGLRLSDSFPNFPPVATPGMHDVNVALRFRANGRLTAVRLINGAPNVQEYTLDGLVGPPLAYFVEANDVMYRWSDTSCSFNNCVNLQGVVGLEPGFVWALVQPMDGSGLLRTASFTRPTHTGANPLLTLPAPASPLLSPGSGFERLPLWLNVTFGSSTDRQLLVSNTDAGVTMTAWPKAEVLRVGRNHVVLSDAEPFFVRVVRK